MQEEMAGNKEEKEGQVQMRNDYSYTQDIRLGLFGALLLLASMDSIETHNQSIICPSQTFKGVCTLFQSLTLVSTNT